MAKLSLISISLGVLFLLHFSAAQHHQPWQQFPGQQSPCQFRRLNTQQPTGRVQAEGGYTEFWDVNNQQFRCAGVTVIRHRIQPRGLLLPSYTNVPLFTFIERGRGFFGVVFPGCASIFQSSQQERGQSQEQGQGFRERHQKIRHFREGDFVAFPAGAAHWVYNDGEEDLIAVVLLDTSNDANQLDFNPRRFFIGGNPQRQEGQRQGQQEQPPNWGNILRGFDTQLLAQVFRMDEETIRRMQGENDKRGHIIKLERELQVTSPPLTREEQQQYDAQEERQFQLHGSKNGLEETICSARLRENLDDPARADFYNPQAGRLSSLNSLNLPILRFLRLSAERGVLYGNAIMTPHWNLNAHSVIYVTNGQGRIQIVDNTGNTVFDDQLQRGQVVVVPQNFAVVKQAGNQGFEWVAFKTNDNAMFNTLAGRTSAFRAIPASVLANAFRISEQEARNLKFNRQETVMLGPGRRRHFSEGGMLANFVEDMIIRRV